LSFRLDQYLKETIKSVKFLSQSYSRHDPHICRRRPTFPSPDKSDLQAEDSLITYFSSTLPCDALGCSSTLTRLHDIVRYKKTIYSPKAQCPYLGYGYTTARSDKMKEYCTKKHSASGKSIFRLRNILYRADSCLV
jgi:hypothetical protein